MYNTAFICRSRLFFLYFNYYFSATKVDILNARIPYPTD